MNIWGQLSNMIRAVVKRALGEKNFAFTILGIPVVSVTKRDANHFNLFLLILPLLQIVTGPKTHTIHILLLAWIWKGFKYLFTGWSFIKSPEFTQFAFCGKAIYEKRVDESYKFPSTAFKDEQVSQ